MIIGDNRKAVIENIKLCAESGEFHNKVELNDPVLTAEQSKKITENYIENRKQPAFKAKTALGVTLAKSAAKIVNKNTVITGLEKIPENLGGCLITSNHFSPLENTVIRYLTNTLGRKRLGIISQTSNFAMTGIVGFLMNYADTIPISSEPHYLAKDFPAILKERLIDKKDAVLLYPEQEMWFNYRKPRPPKNGAYFYAAKLNVPIVSCFVEIIDLNKDDNSEFKKVKYVLHILDVLYPDKNKTVRENTDYLALTDYSLKKACYERVYGKKLTYRFEDGDIAGWKESL
ncbi:MAG TPA: 1-acyl-sn-glycerol-3-phosphate acyltransferase [Ruminococcaceae bacterium]|nr:1-acyl-sn-glycerol-3-phosphate acyltransferase [Oscillospiraceae bacterium]